MDDKLWTGMMVVLIIVLMLLWGIQETTASPRSPMPRMEPLEIVVMPLPYQPSRGSR